MIGLYIRMRDLYRRLRQRVKLIRGDNQYEIDPYFAEAFQDKSDLSNNTGGDTDLDFLYNLTGAINEWLEEIRSSANGRLTHPASYQLGRVGMDLGRYDASHTIDGNMFSSEVIQRIRSFEKAWMERYSRGEDPYTVPVPTLSKELLVHIIQRCPMIEKDIWVSVRKSGDQSSQSRSLQRHSVHSPDWLTKHLGHRFMTKKLVLGHRAETIIHLKNFHLTREISQADLGCSDQAWEKIRPTNRKNAARKIPFGLMSTLMRARCAVTAQGPYEDVWLALMALPPQFLGPLLPYKDKYLDKNWRLKLMVTSPSLDQIKMLEQGWSLASQLSPLDRSMYKRDDLKNVYSDLSSSSDTSDSSGPGKRKTKVRMKSRKSRARVIKPHRREKTDRGKNVLEATLELLKEHPDLYARILDASRRSCSIVNKSIGIIFGLATGGKILHSLVNVNVLTVEDILSLSPGESITTTFMYRIIEMNLLSYGDCDIIPPATVDLYLKTPDKVHMMELACFFRPIEGAPATQVNQVYVLPPATSTPHGLAICSVAPSYCSTLLVGTPEATATLKGFLGDLFRVIFSPTCPDHDGSVLAGFSWDRFHEIPVEPILQACQGGPNDTGTALVAISCESVLAGPRGVLDLLGVGVLPPDFSKSMTVLDIRYKALDNILMHKQYYEPLPYAPRTCARAQNSHMGNVNTPETQGDAHVDAEEQDLVNESGKNLDAEEEDLVNEDEVKMRFQAIANAANHINLDDDVDIEYRISKALSAEERLRLEFTAEDETNILASIVEQGTPDLADDRIKRSVTNYRKHYSAILLSTVKFILTKEFTKSDTGVPPEWIKFFVANATNACRKRLLRLLTDSRFQPISFQYIFGSDHWTSDMLDHFSRLEIERFESLSSSFSSYIGVAHELRNAHGQTWVYEGSATNVSGGEALRMFNGHRVELKRGHDEIMRRRQWSTQTLFIHEKMSTPDTDSFFLSTARYPHQSSIALGLKARLLPYYLRTHSWYCLVVVCPPQENPLRVVVNGQLGPCLANISQFMCSLRRLLHLLGMVLTRFCQFFNPVNLSGDC